MASRPEQVRKVAATLHHRRRHLRRRRPRRADPDRRSPHAHWRRLWHHQADPQRHLWTLKLFVDHSTSTGARRLFVAATIRCRRYHGRHLRLSQRTWTWPFSHPARRLVPVRHGPKPVTVTPARPPTATARRSCSVPARAPRGISWSHLRANRRLALQP